MRRTAAWFLGVFALSVLAVGCGSSSTDTGTSSTGAKVATKRDGASGGPMTTTSAALPPTKDDLQRALPTLAEMPAGWTLLSEVAERDKCSDLGAVGDAKAAPAALGRTHFNASENDVSGGMLDVEARSFASTIAAEKWLTIVQGAADTCATAKNEYPGGVSFSDEVTSAGNVGASKSFGVSRAFRQDGATVTGSGFLTIIAQRGQVAVIVSARDSAEAERWAKRTLSRLV